MFSSLKKLFGNAADGDRPPWSPAFLTNPPPRPSSAARPFSASDNRIAGHLFSVQRSTGPPPMANSSQQRDFDRILLDTLNASPEAWNRSPAVLPLSSDQSGFAGTRTRRRVTKSHSCCNWPPMPKPTWFAMPSRNCVNVNSSSGCSASLKTPPTPR